MITPSGIDFSSCFCIGFGVLHVAILLGLWITPIPGDLDQKYCYVGRVAVMWL